MKEVTMYTKVPCNFCLQAKMLLRALGVTVSEIRIDLDEAKHEEMLRRTNGARTVPQIFIGEHLIGGHSDLLTLYNRGELKPLLGIT